MCAFHTWADKMCGSLIVSLSVKSHELSQILFGICWHFSVIDSLLYAQIVQHFFCSKGCLSRILHKEYNLNNHTHVHGSEGRP